MTTRTQQIAAEINRSQKRLSKVIAITNQKGGVGKTSTTFNFAHYLNELGYRVAVVDLDGQGNLTELFFEPAVLNQYVHTAAVQFFTEEMNEFTPLSHPCGIDVIATQRNSHVLTNVDTQSIDAASLFYENVSRLAEDYDFVVLDTPPAPGIRTTAACASADYIFAPVLVDTFAISALEGVVNSVHAIGGLLDTELKLNGILINQLQDSTEETKHDYAELAAAIGEPLIPTAVRLSKPFRRAMRLGVPVWHLRSSGSEQRTSKEARKAYGEMSSRITEIPKKRIKAFNDYSRVVRMGLAQPEAQSQ